MARSNRRRHPALEGKPEGVWCPEAVGKVPGYPATQEDYTACKARLKATADNARADGRNKRTGCPTGWAGRREEVAKLREEAMGAAWETVRKLPNSQLPDENLDELKAGQAEPATFAEMAAVGMAFAISVVRSPTYGTSLRTMAAKIVLLFVCPKPSKGRLHSGLSGALDFLDGLAEVQPAQDREDATSKSLQFLDGLIEKEKQPA